MRLAAALRLTALLVVLASAPCLAQTPSLAPSVSIALEGDRGIVSVDQIAEFTATVTNTGQASGTPLDEQNSADVTVEVTGVPAGWTASLSPASFRLSAGQSQEVTLQVSVSADAQQGEATLTLTATLRSPVERLDPILGNVPGGTQTATATDSITIARDDSVTRNVLEAIGPWIYAILLLLVAAVLVAVGISVASRRALVRLASETRELPITGGGRAAFPFRIESLAKQADNALLQVSAVQEGWAAFLPLPEVALEPGRAHEVSLIVIAPKDAPEGARQPVLVTATSAKAPRGSASIEFVAVVVPSAADVKATAAKRRKA